MRGLFLLFLLATPAMAKPLVITTFSILGDIVHEIAQDKVELKTLVGPNQDSHVYEPRPQDAKALERAELVVTNGLGFEGWLDRLIKASGFQGKTIVATAGIRPLTEGKFPDPHAWHSLKNAKIYVDNIVKGLSELSPPDAAFFQSQGKAYKRAIDELKEKTQQELKDVPLERRKVITPHDAFAYLGREFQITFFSPLGISTDAEPSAKAIASLIQKIKKENIHAIFVENISNPRLLEQIAQETGSSIGGTLYSDALSPPGTPADTYLKMMSYNLSSLMKVLKKRD